jgi:UDP-3-O-[3-hydroxymyristoyl] glucosamine N-acyltransferase
MRKTVKEIAALIGGDVIGDANTVITGISGIKEAKEGDITFLANLKYAPLVEKTKASAVITSRQVIETSKPVVRTDNPSLAFAKVVSLVSDAKPRHPTGVHQSAVLGKGVKLGRDVAIGPYVVIEDDVVIGDEAIIYAGSFIGHECSLGSGVLIYSNVTIRERAVIGNRVIIHSGTVVGADGFGFISLEGAHQKIPQTGTVEIGDDVEIGANVTIDRARFDKTIIGRGTKIDNLVQIAHNVVIGENCIIVSQAGISGSTILGNNVTLAGQAGLVGHINIGDNAIVMAQAGVSKSVPPQAMVWGYPAKPVAVAKRINASVQNLPRLYNSVAELKKKVRDLEEWINKEQSRKS